MRLKPFPQPLLQTVGALIDQVFRHGELAGYLRLIPHPGDARIAIGRVAVAAPLRRQGLARRLMAEALGRCRQEYADCAVTLTAQTYLVPFYETLGFVATSAPFDDYGLSHVEMALR